MQKITPHLWFDKEAKEAAHFYASVFPDAQITHESTLGGTPSGDTDIVGFEIAGQPFMAISAGPAFKINPSISFFVNFDPSRDPNAKEHLDALWAKLVDGGLAMMPLQEYPFSKHYGWVQDRFGVSWQLMLTNPAGEPRPFIIPSIMFTKELAGNATAASDYYISIFKDSKRGTIATYPAGRGEKEGNVMFTDFSLAGQWLAAMDSSGPHPFQLNEAISLLIPCDTQEEVDYFWGKLSAVPEAAQCGWCKDQFGVSWQVHPVVLDRLLADSDRKKVAAVVQCFMGMQKPDIAELERVYNAA